jgi:serine/threonine-protein kinase
MKGELLKSDEVVGRRYRIVKRLGQGGMGVVYEAEHIALKRRLALKVLLPRYTEDERAVARFKIEAQASASIGHPGIVEVIDLDEDEARGVTFIAMELLEGEELYARIKREGPLSPEFVARAGADMADAVGAAHEEGIIHRDLKPHNVFLARKGRQLDVVKVLDFGLAKLIATDDLGASLTRSGEFLGTPFYMAPEQLHNAKDIDQRADVYSMGVILFQALTSELPYSAESLAELIVKVATEEPSSLRQLRPDLPAQMIEIVEQAIVKDRDQRLGSAIEMRDALEACLEGRDSALIRGIDRSVERAERPTMPHSDLSKPSRRSLECVPEAAPVEMKTSGPRLPLLVGLVLGAVLLVGVALWFMVSLLPGAEDATGVEQPASFRPEEEIPLPPPPTSDPLPEQADGGLAPSVPTTKTVHFVTQPEGAQIMLAREPLCQTPCDAELAEAEATVTVELSGFETETLQLETPMPAEVALTLKRRPGREGPRPTGPGRPGPPPLLPR